MFTFVRFCFQIQFRIWPQNQNRRRQRLLLVRWFPGCQPSDDFPTWGGMSLEGNCSTRIHARTWLLSWAGTPWCEGLHQSAGMGYYSVEHELYTSLSCFLMSNVWRFTDCKPTKQYKNVGDMCGSTGQESCRTQFDSLPLHEWESSRRGGAYDIRSVMHYGTFSFYLFHNFFEEKPQKRKAPYPAYNVIKF